MVKTDIQTKEGMKLSVEGTEEEVKRLIEFVRGPITEVKHFVPVASENKSTNSGNAVYGYIDELKAEGFFSKTQGLSEIKSALDAKGHIYPITTLSSRMLEKVKLRDLGRIKEGGKWKYVAR